jgi:hypothetical protein
MALTEFLTARLDEDEALARAATPGEWIGPAPEGQDHAGQPVLCVEVDVTWSERPIQRALFIADSGSHEDAIHIDRWQPARVLREVDAKRKIVADYERVLSERKAHHGDLALAGALLALHGAVRALAAAYSDHPDYYPGWTTDRERAGHGN